MEKGNSYKSYFKIGNKKYNKLNNVINIDNKLIDIPNFSNFKIYFKIPNTKV